MLASIACVGTYDSALPPPTIPTHTPSPVPTQEPPVCETVWDALNDSRCPRPQPSIKRRVLNSIFWHGPRVRNLEELRQLAAAPMERSEDFMPWLQRPAGIYWQTGRNEATLGVTVRQTIPWVGMGYNRAYEDESLRKDQASLEFVCRNGRIAAEFHYWHPFHDLTPREERYYVEWSMGGDHIARDKWQVSGGGDHFKAWKDDARDMWEAVQESDKIAINVTSGVSGLVRGGRGQFGFQNAWMKANHVLPFLERCGEY